MPEAANRQFLLAARPHGMVKESDFEYREVPVPAPGPGQALIKTSHISLDPSMRGNMENRADYVAPLALGDVMRARGVGTVVASDNPRYAEGAQVTGTFGMQDYALSDGKRLPMRTFDRSIDPKVALGVLGGTGMTAYFGLLDIGQPKADDVVMISGAAGATGSVAGQIAKIKGCTVFGMAGSDEKCAWLTGELGFDGAFNYKTADAAAEVERLCPNGIDVFFDNVGGEILDICLDRIAMNARIVICGGISRYNATEQPPGPRNYFNLVFRRARMEGFIVIDYEHRYPEAEAEMRRWIDAGKLRQQATVIDGFKELPRALIKLFEGFNTGKMMVRTS